MFYPESDMLIYNFSVHSKVYVGIGIESALEMG